MDPIKVLLAEDHHMVRAAFARYLAGTPDIQVVGEVADGGELMPAVAAAQPDVVLLDVVMPGLDAPQATRALKAAYPDLKVLVLSAHKREAYVLGLLEAGAAGYMLKDDAPATLVAAIRAVARGEMWLSPQVTELALGRRETGPALTPRQREVLRLLARGYSNDRIAQELGLRERTVKNHVSRLYRKLGVRSRTEAVLYAVRQGWVEVEE
jgi:DNA-binding NarL/FixJ family response regulator